MNNKTVITFALCIFLGLVGACSTLASIFGEDTVVTTVDQVEEGGEYAVIPVEQLPESLRAGIPEGSVVVVTGKEDLKPNATYVPTSEVPDDLGREGIVKTLFGIGSTFIPGLAAWEGVGLLLSKRKRKHYAKAIKSAVPMDKKVDLGQAVVSLAAALGFLHSSKETEDVFEGEAHVEDNTGYTTGFSHKETAGSPHILEE